MGNKKSILVVGAFMVLLAFFVLGENKLEKKSGGEVRIAGQVLEVTIADTPEMQMMGLSGTAGLAEDEGMLFIFDQPDAYKFWMKDMLFPIDMIWLDSDKRVIHIKENAVPESYPESYGPKEDVLYVLETAAGFTHKYNLKIGDRAEF